MTRLGPTTVLAINQTAGTTNKPDSRSNFASGRRIVTVSSGDRSSNMTMIPLARAETRWRTAGERENLVVPYAKHRALDATLRTHRNAGKTLLFPSHAGAQVTCSFYFLSEGFSGGMIVRSIMIIAGNR